MSYGQPNIATNNSNVKIKIQIDSTENGLKKKRDEKLIVWDGCVCGVVVVCVFFLGGWEFILYLL